MNIEQLLKELTLEEKAALCSGKNFWETTPIKRLGIPSVMMTDGPHGLRKENKAAAAGNVMQPSYPATCFPTAATIASSWNLDLAKEIGVALAEEAIDQGVSTILGPGINIKRNPLCGRNFEYFSEDPFLAGKLGESYVSGVQSQKIGTSLKHFAVNSQEYRRMTVSSDLDERTLREIYLSAFENTVRKAQPYTIMCSYNPVNGVHLSDNKKLLSDILRDEWGFQGIVVSDWGAVNDRVKGILAGMDLEMPSSNGERDADIVRAVRDGSLSEEALDKVVYRVLEYVFKCHENMEGHKGKTADYASHHKLARKAAADGIVLLKNEGLLPLEKTSKIAVIGDMAKDMCRYQGSGSSRINPANLVTFTQYLDEIKADYSFAKGYERDGDIVNNGLISQAVDLAKTVEKVVLVIGLTDEYESEGFDRRHIDLPPAHLKLAEEVINANPDTVVVLLGGSPVKMPFLQEAKSVLYAYLGGEAGGEGLYDVIFGDVNPSGKLAETFPLSMSDNPAYLYYGMGPQAVEYRESIFVGYRFFDKAKKPVQFPFGYGLSYTSFEYSNLKIDGYNVSFDITNTGDRDGAEVAQLYVRDLVSTPFREYQALKGFSKVFLKAGETKTLSIVLNDRAFSFYNDIANKWQIEEGDFEIAVGASSRDIRLSETIFVKGNSSDSIPDFGVTAPVYYNLESAIEYPAIQFERLIGRPLTENRPLTRTEIGFNATLGDLNVSCFGRFLRWIAYSLSPMLLPKDSPKVTKKMVQLSALDLPIRNMYAMTNGIVPKYSIEGLLHTFTAPRFHRWKGYFRLIFGMLKKRSYKEKLYS